MTADELASAVGRHAAEELADALAKIKHCIGQLDESAIWSRPGAGLNSIGNLLLHLEGNLTQWIASGLGGAEDLRNRAAEFAERGPIPADALLRRLDVAVAQASAALACLSADELAKTRRIQGFDVTGLAAIFHSVPHFRGHAQEIVHLTRALLGERYQMHWQPATPEQGAAS